MPPKRSLADIVRDIVKDYPEQYDDLFVEVCSTRCRICVNIPLAIKKSTIVDHAFSAAHLRHKSNLKLGLSKSQATIVESMNSAEAEADLVIVHSREWNQRNYRAHVLDHGICR